MKKTKNKIFNDINDYFIGEIQDVNSNDTDLNTYQLSSKEMAGKIKKYDWRNADSENQNNYRYPMIELPKIPSRLKIDYKKNKINKNIKKLKEGLKKDIAHDIVIFDDYKIIQQREIAKLKEQIKELEEQNKKLKKQQEIYKKNLYFEKQKQNYENQKLNDIIDGKYGTKPYKYLKMQLYNKAIKQPKNKKIKPIIKHKIIYK